MRSSIGPCGLSAQRLRAAETSSAKLSAARSSTRVQPIFVIRLKTMGSLPACEPGKWPGQALPDGEHLEELAHLCGRQELLRLGGDRGVMQEVLGVGLGEHFGDAAIDQELRLRRVAEHLGA